MLEDSSETSRLLRLLIVSVLVISVVELLSILETVPSKLLSVVVVTSEVVSLFSDTTVSSAFTVEPKNIRPTRAEAKPIPLNFLNE